MELALFLVYSLMFILGLGVVYLGNPVHSVVMLVGMFCVGGGLLVFLGLEFISFIVIIVYVGAIAILLLFVVMMLQIRSLESQNNHIFLLPLSLFLGVYFLSAVLYSGGYLYFRLRSEGYTSVLFFQKGEVNSWVDFEWINFLSEVHNTAVLGEVMFRFYIIYFLIAGFILLCAMVGAIGLTLEVRGWYIAKSKQQEIYKQVSQYTLDDKENNLVYFK